MARRIPIVNRTAIYQRIAQGSIPVEYHNCQLCENNKDCSGYEYHDPEQDVSMSVDKAQYRKFWVNKDFEDWDKLSYVVKIGQVVGTNLRLIIDKPIPDYIIWSLAHSPLNILQINIDMLHTEGNMGWVANMVSLCDKCGVYSVLFMNPLVPTVTKTYHVIEVIDNFRNMGSHVSLKFIDLPDLEVIDGYINFNGTAIPTKYLKKTESGFVCNEFYIEKFMDKVNSYARPYKISVSVCNYGEDCTGLGLED